METYEEKIQRGRRALEGLASVDERVRRETDPELWQGLEQIEQAGRTREISKAHWLAQFTQFDAWTPGGRQVFLRSAALDALHEMPAAAFEAGRELARTLSPDASAHRKIGLCKVLEASGSVAAVRLLEPLLHDGHRGVRQEAGSAVRSLLANRLSRQSPGEAMPVLQIPHRRTGKVLLELPAGSLEHANLQRAALWGADLRFATLRAANLSHADFREADLSFTDLLDANLDHVDLTGAHLQSARLLGTTFVNANLAGADLSRTEMIGTRLTDAWLGGATLEEAYLSNVRFDGARYDAATRWPAGLDPAAAGAVNVDASGPRHAP
jgi:hypothetical protein